MGVARRKVGKRERAPEYKKLTIIAKRLEKHAATWVFKLPHLYIRSQSGGRQWRSQVWSGFVMADYHTSVLPLSLSHCVKCGSAFGNICCLNYAITQAILVVAVVVFVTHFALLSCLVPGVLFLLLARALSYRPHDLRHTLNTNDNT